jgi:hypothetical protein
MTAKSDEPEGRRVQYEVRRIQATLWETYGLEDDSGRVGIFRRVEVTTDLGMRNQTVSLNYHKTPRGWVGFILITTNYALSKPDDEDGYYALEVSGNDEKIAGLALKGTSGAAGETLMTDDPKDFREIVTCFISELDLTLNIFGRYGLAGSFPIPHDPAFIQAFKLVKAAVDSSAQ